MTIYGRIIRINSDDSIDYLRDNLTMWTTSKSMIERGDIISEDEFLEKVFSNAKDSGVKIPSKDEVLSVVKLVEENVYVDYSKILGALNI